MKNAPCFHCPDRVYPTADNPATCKTSCAAYIDYLAACQAANKARRQEGEINRTLDRSIKTHIPAKKRRWRA